jgi:hypothetical protein
MGIKKCLIDVIIKLTAFNISVKTATNIRLFFEKTKRF